MRSEKATPAILSSSSLALLLGVNLRRWGWELLGQFVPQTPQLTHFFAVSENRKKKGHMRL